MGLLDRVGQPDFGLIWSQQIAAFCRSHHQQRLALRRSSANGFHSGGGYKNCRKLHTFASCAHCIACFSSIANPAALPHRIEHLVHSSPPIQSTALSRLLICLLR